MVCAVPGATAAAARTSCSVLLHDGTRRSLIVPGRELFHVSTDEPMMASMAGRYAAALFELGQGAKAASRRSRRTSRPSRPCWTSSEDLRRLVRSPVISAGRSGARRSAPCSSKAGISRPDRQFPQADRPQPAPVRRRRHAQGLPRAARPRARRGERRRRLRPSAQRRRRCTR